MSSECPSNEQPKLGFAIPDAELRQSLLESLEKFDCTIERLEPGQDLWSDMDSMDVDVLVVRRRSLTPGALDQLQDRLESDDAPSVVILDDKGTEEDRTHLVASGVSRVLDSADDPKHLATALESLGQAEAAGGVEGPEVGGAETQPRLADFLSRSPYMREFIEMVRKVSDADASLLITGETGVGKERLARAIHAQSPRCDEPFIAVNCGALSESLLESELFGHERGAFTGADSKRVGRFEQAHKGTIFLDEIGEMSAHLQVKLLTVLQRREIQRLGGSDIIKLDVRVMAATNRDVREDVEAGKFREDLYYRLNVIALELPALRERLADIPDLVGLLISHFQESSIGPKVTGVTAEALEALKNHDWPGNIRELVNVVERAMLLTPASKITIDSLPPELLDAEESGSSTATSSMSSGRGREAIPAEWLELPIKTVREKATAWAERAYLQEWLERNEGSVGQTAKQAGISSRALYDRMKRYELDKDDFK